MVKKKKLQKEESSVSSCSSSSTYSSEVATRRSDSPNRSQTSRMSLYDFIETNTPAKTKKARAFTGAAAPVTPKKKKTKKAVDDDDSPKKKKKVKAAEVTTASPTKKKKIKAAEEEALSPTTKKKVKAVAAGGDVASPTKKKKQDSNAVAASPTKAKKAEAAPTASPAKAKKAVTPKTPKKATKKPVKEMEAQTLSPKKQNKKAAKEIEAQALGLSTKTPKKKKVIKKKQEDDPPVKAAPPAKKVVKVVQNSSSSTATEKSELIPAHRIQSNAKTASSLEKKAAPIDDSSSSSAESELIPAHQMNSKTSNTAKVASPSPRREEHHQGDSDSSSSSEEDSVPASSKSQPVSPKRSPLSPKRTPVKRVNSSSSSSSSSSGDDEQDVSPRRPTKKRADSIGSSSCSSDDDDQPISSPKRSQVKRADSDSSSGSGSDSDDSDAPQKHLTVERVVSRSESESSSSSSGSQSLTETKVAHSPKRMNSDSSSSSDDTKSQQPLKRHDSSSSSSSGSSEENEDEKEDPRRMRDQKISSMLNDYSESSGSQKRKSVGSSLSTTSLDSEAPISLTLRPGGTVRPQAPNKVDSGVSTDSEPPIHLGLRPQTSQKSISGSSSSSDSEPPISLGLRPRGITRCLSDSTIDTTPPISLSLRPGTNTVTFEDANRVESPKRLLRSDSDDSSVLDPYVDGEYFLSSYETQRRQILKRRPPARFATKSFEKITSLKDRIQSLSPKNEVRPPPLPVSYVSPRKTTDVPKNENKSRDPKATKVRECKSSFVREAASPQRRSSTYDGERSQAFRDVQRMFKKAVHEEVSDESDAETQKLVHEQVELPSPTRKKQNDGFDSEQSMTFRELQSKLKRAVNEQVSDDETGKEEPNAPQNDEDTLPVEGRIEFDGEKSMTFRELQRFAKRSANESTSDDETEQNERKENPNPHDSFAARIFIPKKISAKEDIPSGFSTRFQELKKQAMKIAREIDDSEDEKRTAEETFTRSPTTRRHSTCGAHGMRYLENLPTSMQSKELVSPTGPKAENALSIIAEKMSAERVTDKQVSARDSPWRRHSTLVSATTLPFASIAEEGSPIKNSATDNPTVELSCLHATDRKIRSPPKRAASKSLANVGSLQDRIKTLSFMAGAKPTLQSSPKGKTSTGEAQIRCPITRSVSKTLEHVGPIKDRMKFLNANNEPAGRDQKLAPVQNTSMLPSPLRNKALNGKERNFCQRRASLDNASIAKIKLSSPTKETVSSTTTNALISPLNSFFPSKTSISKPNSAAGALASPFRRGQSQFSQVEKLKKVNPTMNLETEKESTPQYEDNGAYINDNESGPSQRDHDSEESESSNSDDSLETLQKEASTLRNELNKVHEAAGSKGDSSSNSSSSSGEDDRYLNWYDSKRVGHRTNTHYAL